MITEPIIQGTSTYIFTLDFPLDLLRDNLRQFSDRDLYVPAGSRRWQFYNVAGSQKLLPHLPQLPSLIVHSLPLSLLTSSLPSFDQYWLGSYNLRFCSEQNDFQLFGNGTHRILSASLHQIKAP